MTKPDRWTRVVKRAVERSAPPRTWEKAIGYHLRDNEVIPLLRAEHRATVRAVKRLKRNYELEHSLLRDELRVSSNYVYMSQTCNDLLAYLKERAK